MDNYEKYQELLDKWKNFSKVYDAIHEAYKLGYEEGVKIERESREIARCEMRKIKNMPSAI